MSGEKILLVDDDYGLVQGLQLLLDERDYQVANAADGSEAMRMVYQFRPDLVILDVVMPGMSGWDVCKRIREMSDIPIIMLTAKDSESEIVHGFDLGATDYVTKPFRPRELLARVSAALKAWQGRATEINTQHIYSDGHLMIDLKSHAASLDGEALRFSPIEFRLLGCLIRNAGQVVSHRTLLEEVWGEEYRDEIAYLKVYIRYLRTKLNESTKEPYYIHTVWGVGYTFRVANAP